MQKALQDALDALREYCARFPKTAIYGAGNRGRVMARFLEEQGIAYSYFCSTEKHKDFFEGREVKAIDEISPEDTGVLVAVAEKNLHHVLDLLDSRGIGYYYNGPLLNYAFACSGEGSVSRFEVKDGYLTAIDGMPLDAGTLYIACTGGIGDTLYAAGFVEAYRREHPETKRVCLLLWERQRELEHVFPGIDEAIVSDERVETARQYYCYMASVGFPERCRLKNCIYAQGGGKILDTFRGYVMGLPASAQLAKPNLSPNGQKPQRRKRAVVLMPYANSMSLLPEKFWEELVAALREKGCIVYTNVGSYRGERALSGTEPVAGGLLETVAFCAGCDAVIALRSGMCDLLAFSKANLIVLNSVEVVFQDWNLKDVFSRENIYNVSCFRGTDLRAAAAEVLGVLDRLGEEAAP